MHEIGKLLVVAGLLLAGLGLLLWKGAGRFLPGRLPGDIVVEKAGWSFYFPITTCVVISLVLTLLAWLVRRWFS